MKCSQKRYVLRLGVEFTLGVLAYIVDNAVEKIEELAEENRLDSSASVGVAHFLLGNNGDTEKLSAKQRHHFDNCIQPLIENVVCEGVIGPLDEGDTCNGNG